MALPAPIIRFLRTWDAASEIGTPHPWGAVSRNPSLPHLHDANRAWVFDAPTPSLADLQAAMAAAQRAFPVAFTQVEVVDTDGRAQFVDELSAWLGPPPDIFVFMIASAAPPRHLLAMPPGVSVVERPFPTRELWLSLIEAGHSDEEPLPKEVLEEFAMRDTTVAMRGNVRFFVARREGEILAYTSLLTHHGIALIDNVATLPAHRRQGAASAVVGSALAASAAAGNATTCLFTHEGGSAQRIYERLGMRAIIRAAQFRLDEPQPLELR